MPRMTADEIYALLAATFPQAKGFCEITAIRDDELDCVVRYREAFLRPGGTLSGPTLMTLADTAMYFLVLAMSGPQPLAVTSSLTINFLRKPPPADLHATARMLKLGKRLAVGEVHLRGGDPAVVVAQASVTYALPA
ncbi:MAG: PaaI family thioesterase [Myxococcales bacterium]|nr:PaaI family thioesterase [Myxococcales bacterium]